MRRLFALCVLTACAATAAQAETWKPYATAPNGLQWSYDADYSYRDAKSGRVVVMQAVGKPGAAPRMGPSGPGKPDGVGNVVALDCKARTILMLGSYSPKKSLELSDKWRNTKGKPTAGPDDVALLNAACAEQVAER